MAKRRRNGLGHASKKHEQYAENMMDAYERSRSVAINAAREGNCARALDEAVYAAWARGMAEGHHHSTKPTKPNERTFPTRFSRGGPKVVQDDLGYVFSRCSRR